MDHDVLYLWTEYILKEKQNLLKVNEFEFLNGWWRFGPLPSIQDRSRIRRELIEKFSADKAKAESMDKQDTMQDSNLDYIQKFVWDLLSCNYLAKFNQFKKKINQNYTLPCLQIKHSLHNWQCVPFIITICFLFVCLYKKFLILLYLYSCGLPINYRQLLSLLFSLDKKLAHVFVVRCFPHNVYNNLSVKNGFLRDVN
ncbi:hypothetical protein RFI_25387 [Reticulomyxa filosa]|uniref:Uncharacterized protein n=1 Tax=Reticulomyxa filosa TaxID=46433 RepID=X6MD94_RETFI|nr:hypothetical protein RFI_25387 [Reticulomyxa filosa]|eukprot:ETO11988.1 hypothetical protein RFI_25387 [Reticulomyxa filosa]